MIYDELRLDEEEEKFGKLAHEDDESDLVSEGARHSSHYFFLVDLYIFPNRPPSANAEESDT